MTYFGRLATSVLLGFALLAPAFTADAAAVAVDSAIGTLAAGGIAVYDTYGSTKPTQAVSGTPSAMRFTRWQLSNMLGEANAHAGMSGASIDAMEGKKAPKHAPKFSTFMAAWIKRGSGPLARYAQQLMGTQDWTKAAQITFPTLVIDMFIGDAARMMPGVTKSAQHASWERWIASPAQAGDICSTVSSFISDVVSDVTNALTVSGNGFFATLWNTAITLVSGLAEVAINGVLTPLLSILTAVAGGLAAISGIASMLQPWSVTVAAQPTEITIGQSPNQGQFVATLNAQAINWPSDVSGCASALSGVNLNAISYVDAPVTWKTTGQIPGKANVTSKDGAINANKQATLRYQTVTVQQQSGTTCPTQVQSAGSGGVQVHVERADVEKLEEDLAHLAFSKLPSLVRTHLEPIFQAEASSAEAQFAQLIAKAPSGSAYVTFNESKPSQNCTPPPSPKSGYNANSFLGHWACSFGTGKISGVMYTTTTTVGTSVGYMSVEGHTTPSWSSNWTYNPTGPNSGTLSSIDPGLVAEAQANYERLKTPAPGSISSAHQTQVEWLSPTHLIMTGAQGGHSARYDCTRTSL